jgi:DNA invertase Pin-like site-specific DNA recombinase
MTAPRDGRPAKRAVIYLRTRTVGGTDRHVDAQLDRQRQACQRIAEAHGGTVVHEYTAIGGTRDPHVRYIVSALCQGAAEHQADYVITAGLDRLCRGPAKADREVMQAIRDSGARLICGLTWDIALPGPSIDDLAEAARRPWFIGAAAAGRTA